MFVKWGNCDSSSFTVTNGVRQGGVLYPKLFTVVISDQLNNSNIGGNFGGGVKNCYSLLLYECCIRSLLYYKNRVAVV